MTKLKRWGAFAATVMLLATGCSQGNGTPSISEPSPDIAMVSYDNLIREMDSLYAMLDTSRLPQKDNGYWQDATEAEMPPQLVSDHPLAMQIALHIRKGYLYADGNLLEPFGDIDESFRPAILQTALYTTASVDWGELDDEGNSTNPDHVLTWLVKNEIEEQRMPSALLYASDVDETIATYYGDLDFMHMTPPNHYLYYGREEVYCQIGDYGGPAWRYPQITSIQETDDGVVCEAVLVWAMSPDEPMWTDENVDLTADNFLSATVESPLYRYTFRQENDGRLC